MEEDKKEKGFVIKDRRHFDESGSVRKEEETKAEEKKPERRPPEAAGITQEGAAAPENENPSDPEINFASFIFSLSTTAMYHFGDFPDPVTRESKRNLAAAKQTIDILNILKTKTEGNLDDDEKKLLYGILYELQMRFVKEMSNR
jgi:hypothetical protein